jgi:hypothetical protein
MVDKLFASDAMDDALRVEVEQTLRRLQENPSPENRAAYRQAVRVFADRVLYNRPPVEPR